MILAGDIGGTNTRLAYFAEENGAIVWKLHARYPSPKYASLNEIVADFINEHHLPVNYAAFGIAGPVVDGSVHTTNLPWIVTTKSLSLLLKMDSVYLLNDLEANTWGMFTLSESDFFSLNEGERTERGNVAVISAGTGLGEAGATWLAGEYHPFGCEGGHTNFSPQDEAQDLLLSYLRKKFGHVSWERVLSGDGLYNIYCFLRDTKYGEESDWLHEQFSQHNSGQVVTTNALSGSSKACEEALSMFCDLYGVQAGNLALQFMARGGVFLGGGIAPKIITKLKSSNFMNCFTDKGRMKPYLQSIPIKVVLNDNAALLGCCSYALHMAGIKKKIVV